MASFKPLHDRLPNLRGYTDAINRVKLVRREGKITEVVGQLIVAYNPGTAVGGLCTIYNPDTQQRVMAEVIGFRGEMALLMALGQMTDISPRCRVIPEHRAPTVGVGEELKGRVLDGLGRPIDQKGEVGCRYEMPLYA